VAALLFRVRNIIKIILYGCKMSVLIQTPSPPGATYCFKQGSGYVVMMMILHATTILIP
jgi:hypothetical protein